MTVWNIISIEKNELKSRNVGQLPKIKDLFMTGLNKTAMKLKKYKTTGLNKPAMKLKKYKTALNL